MKHTIPPHLKTNLWFVIQYVILYCLLFNSTVFLYHSGLAKTCDGGELFHAGEGGFYWYVKTLFLMLFWVFALFYILSYNRLLFCCAVPAIFLTSALVTYAEYIQKTPVNDNIISAAFQTNTGEIQDLVGWPIIVWLVFIFVLCGLVLVRYMKYFTPAAGKTSTLAIGGFFSVIIGGGVFLINGDYLSPWDFHPYDYTVIAARYLSLKANVEHLHKDKFNVATLPSSWAKDDQHPLYVIFVLGESVRADHLSLNGYTAHDTTPLLSKEPNLINFSNVSSCGTITAVSVPCLMTRATRKNFAPAKTETSFISIFRALGFKTVWMSEQTRFLNITSPVTSIAKESEEEIFEDNSFSKKSQKVLDHFDKLIANSKGNMLTVFHMIGSHWFYEWRYPSEFRRYMPVCMSTLPNFCAADNLINSYDNTILYLDYFLAHTIDLLQEKNAILVYISDHGEYLGEKGRYLHGQDTEDAELRHVPMIWWVSDTFKRLHPEAVARMQDKRDAVLSQDYIFHSILDCAGIQSQAIDKKLSICN